MSGINFSIAVPPTATAESVITEAIAAGIPVVGTLIGSASEMIDDGVTGWLVPLEAIEMMASKILLFAQNSDLCKQMGREGRNEPKNYLVLMSMFGRCSQFMMICFFSPNRL